MNLNPMQQLKELRDMLAINERTISDYEQGRQDQRHSIADSLDRILDAEGDGGAVAEVCGGLAIHWVDQGPVSQIINQHNIRIGDKLYTHPARSGVVSDEQVRQAVSVAEKMGHLTLGGGMRDSAMRAALEDFIKSKGESHG
jgi:hypothetical protein